MAGGFVYIEYTGSDAGQVLTHLVASGGRDSGYDEEEETHRLTSQAGFQPNPEPDNYEEEEEGDDDGPDDHQRGLEPGRATGYGDTLW